MPEDAELAVEEILPEDSAASGDLSDSGDMDNSGDMAGSGDSSESGDVAAPGDSAGSEDDADTSSVYDEYIAKTENALGMEEGSAGYIRLFDISIIHKDDSSMKYQPAPGTTVDVKIQLADSTSEDLSVVHFANENDSGSVVDNSTDGQTVSFEADGFSVYAVIQKEILTGDDQNIAHF